MLINGKCVQCNRENSLTFSDFTVAAECLCEFRKNFVRSSAEARKKMAAILMKNHGTASKLLRKNSAQPHSKTIKYIFVYYTRSSFFQSYYKEPLFRKICLKININAILYVNKCLLLSRVHLLDSNQLQLTERLLERK